MQYWHGKQDRKKKVKQGDSGNTKSNKQKLAKSSNSNKNKKLKQEHMHLLHTNLVQKWQTQDIKKFLEKYILFNAWWYVEQKLLMLKTKIQKILYNINWRHIKILSFHNLLNLKSYKENS